MPNDGDLLTTGEAARTLEVSIDTVRRWGRDGRLPMLRTPSGHRRFRRSDVDAAIAFVPPAEAGSVAINLTLAFAAFILGALLLLVPLAQAANRQGGVERDRQAPVAALICEASPGCVP